MKLLIKLFIAMGILTIAGIALLLVLVDPNDYKTEIESQVKQSINRDLHIKGDLNWALYPQLGFSSGEIELDNIKGFDKPHLVKIKQASLGINILPLLQGKLSLAKLTIDGFELTLLTDKEGVSNLDNMSTETDLATNETVTANEPTENSESQGESFLDLSQTQLAGIDINNALIEVQDLQAGSYQKIAINEIKLGEFALNRETELSLNTALTIDDIDAQLTLSTQLLVNNELDNISLKQLLLNTQLTTDALPNGGLQSTLKSNINYAVNSQKVTVEGLDINTVISGDNLPNKKVTTQVNADLIYLVESQQATINNLKLLIDDLSLDGEMSVQTGDITKVRYNLVANMWDLTPYMPETTTSDKSAGKSTPTATEPAPEVEPDLSFLKTLDIDGTLKVAGVIVDKVTIGEINNHLIINKGKAQITPLSAVLYDGLLTVNGSVDESNGLNKYQVTSKLENVQLLPLLKDAADLTLISGDTSFNFSGSGQGLTATKIQQGLVGKGDFALLDGELYGININQELRGIKAMLKGEDAPTEDSIKKTDFASLTGNFSINKGLVNNQKLLMTSPVMRLDGAGLVDTIKQSLDYKLSISPLSKTTAETDYSDLSGITIPLLITGTFTDPNFSVDTDAVLQEQLQAELDKQKAKLQEKAQEELKKQTEKIGNKALEGVINSFF